MNISILQFSTIYHKINDVNNDLAMSQIIVGIIGIPLGFVMLKYTVQIKDFVGSIDWAEKHLGSGGTYTLLKIIAILVSLLSFLYMVGTLQLMIGNFFAPLSGGNRI